MKYQPTKDLKLWDKNPRQISKENFEALKRSLEKDKKFLEKRPLLGFKQDDKIIIYAGNMRLRAAKELGWQEIPVIIDKDVNNEDGSLNTKLMEERAIKDNSEYGTFDMDILANEFDFKDLKDMDIPEMDFVLPELGGEDEFDGSEDVVPEKVDPICKKGGLWQLGEHRLYCGDATKKEDVGKLMGGEKADLILTDPPYNIGYEGSGRNNSKKIINDEMESNEFDSFLDNVFVNFSKIIKLESAVYVFHSSTTQTQFQFVMEKHSFVIKSQIIWNKPGATFGWADYKQKHEPIFYAGVKGGKTKFYGDRTQKTVWDFNKKTDQQLLNIIKRWRKAEEEGKTTIWSMRKDAFGDYVHPTQKPVELLCLAIKNSSEIGDIVVDFFGGSGSTLIACEIKQRKARIMEIDPHYCDVIIKRWEDFTGLKAKQLS